MRTRSYSKSPSPIALALYRTSDSTFGRIKYQRFMKEEVPGQAQNRWISHTHNLGVGGWDSGQGDSGISDLPHPPTCLPRDPRTLQPPSWLPASMK